MNERREKLVSDVKLLVNDTEDLVKAGAAEAAERLAKLEAAAAANAKAVAQKTKAAATAADEYVHIHPWTAIGISAGVGLIVGLLIGRR